MDCKNCSIVNVCIIYDAFKNYSQYADIAITQCTIRPNTKEIAGNQFPNLSNLTGERPIRNFTTISNQQKKIEEEQKKNKSKETLKIIPVENKAQKITCPTCGGETTDDDLNVCSDCGKTICSNCGVEDLNSNSQKCEICFKK